MTRRISLFEAVSRYKAERDVPRNGYGWYRAFAQRGEAVPLGDVRLKVIKAGGTWTVAEPGVDRAISKHRAQRAFKSRLARDYARGVFQVRSRQRLATAWGSYRFTGGFRVEEVYGKDGGTTTYYCAKCNVVASMRHDRPECHVCSDWRGCGRDCTLSEVACRQCGRTLKI